MFYMLTPNHSLQTCGSPEVVISTTVLGNVVENQLWKAGTPYLVHSSWAPLLRKKQEIQPPWPSKLGLCQQGPLAVGELPTKTDEPILAVYLL